MAETWHYSCAHNIYIEIHPTAITATHLSLQQLGLYMLIISSISFLFIQYFDTWPKQLYEQFSGVAGMWNSLRYSENNTDNYMPSLTTHARDTYWICYWEISNIKHVHNFIKVIPLLLNVWSKLYRSMEDSPQFILHAFPAWEIRTGQGVTLLRCIRDAPNMKLS
jgi:hypothetical protein